jgi:hypothetical protein
LNVNNWGFLFNPSASRTTDAPNLLRTPQTYYRKPETYYWRLKLTTGGQKVITDTLKPTTDASKPTTDTSKLTTDASNLLRKTEKLIWFCPLRVYLINSVKDLRYAACSGLDRYKKREGVSKF